MRGWDFDLTGDDDKGKKATPGRTNKGKRPANAPPNVNLTINEPAFRRPRLNNGAGPSRPAPMFLNLTATNATNENENETTHAARDPKATKRACFATMPVPPEYVQVGRPGDGWMRRGFGNGAFALKPHQVRVSQTFVHPETPGVLLFYSTGSGKTLASVAAAENLAHFEQRWRRVVVIMPAPLVPLFNSTLRTLAPAHPGLFQVMSYHALLGCPLRDLHKLGRDAVLIVDEVQALRNPNNSDHSKRNLLDCVLAVSSTAHKRLLLSGTPIMNYPYEIGSVLALLYPHRVTEVLKRWRQGNNGKEVSEATFVARYGINATQHQDELRAMLRCTVLFYEPNAENKRMYPRVEDQVVKVPMLPMQAGLHCTAVDNKKAQELMERARRRAEQGLEEPSAAVTFLVGPRQFALYVRDTSPPFFVESPKLDRACETIAAEVTKRHPGKCIVYSSFLKHGLDVMHTMLRDRGIPCAVFTGSTKDKDREAIIRRYNTGEVRVLLMSDAGKEGLDLKETTQVHVMEPQWNEAKIQQVIGRAVRYGSHAEGQASKVSVFRYVAVLRFPCVGVKTVLSKQSADQFLQHLSDAKHARNKRFLEWLKAVALENEGVCF